jgi:manganese/zinc/iron transport system substrate-binding protein
VVALLPAGCGTSALVLGPYRGPYPYHAVCTTGAVAELVRQVAGKRARVTRILGAGVEAETYKASPDDVSLVNDADIIFSSGGHLEAGLGELLGRMARKKPVCAIADRLPENPAPWLEASARSKAAEVVRDALKVFDPDHADEYDHNTAAYQKHLTEACARVPEQRRWARRS